MIIGHIEGCTRILGKSQGYLGLPLRDEFINSRVTGSLTPIMVSAWLPTPDELALLNRGASIHVKLVGLAHPPIIVEVGPVPE